MGSLAILVNRTVQTTEAFYGQIERVYRHVLSVRLNPILLVRGRGERVHSSYLIAPPSYNERLISSK